MGSCAFKRDDSFCEMGLGLALSKTPAHPIQICSSTCMHGAGWACAYRAPPFGIRYGCACTMLRIAPNRIANCMYHDRAVLLLSLSSRVCVCECVCDRKNNN